MDTIDSITDAYFSKSNFIPEIIPYAILLLNYFLFQSLRSLVNKLFTHLIVENFTKSNKQKQQQQQQTNTRNKWMLIIKLFAFELIATCELCADCAELNVIFEKHGSLAYGLALCILTYVWIETFGDAHTTPGYLFEDYFWQQGNQLLKSGNTYARFIGQSLAMPIAWRLATIYWRFHLINEHRSMLSTMTIMDHTDDGNMGNLDNSTDSGSFMLLAKQYKCKTSLTTTPVYGFLIELICCMLCRLVELIGQKLLEQNRISQRLFSAFCSFFCSLLVVTALELSGGYFNPILAASLEYGCQGIDFYQHALVFWLGPLTGHVIARGLYKRFVSDASSINKMATTIGQLTGSGNIKQVERLQRPIAAVKSTTKSASTNSNTAVTRSSQKNVHYEHLNDNKPDLTGTRSGSHRRRSRH